MTREEENDPPDDGHQVFVNLTIANALRGLIEELPEAMLLLTLNGRILAANRVAVATLHADEDAIVGAPLSFLVEDGAHMIEPTLHRAAYSPSPVYASFRFVPRNQDIDVWMSHAKLGPETEAPTVLAVRLLSDLDANANAPLASDENEIRAVK